jgi:hypothetical protein
MLAYRDKLVPVPVPAAVRIASKFGAFSDLDAAGVYVGFMAGVRASNPAKAEDLAAKMLAVPTQRRHSNPMLWRERAGYREYPTRGNLAPSFPSIGPLSSPEDVQVFLGP